MRSSNVALLVVSLLGATSVLSQARADNILIENDGSKWKLGSTVSNPLPVNVTRGAVIEFRVTGPHGVVTLNKPGDQMPSPDLEFVLACGEKPDSKPNY